jgi:hypothetical protein
VAAAGLFQRHPDVAGLSFNSPKVAALRALITTVPPRGAKIGRQVMSNAFRWFEGEGLTGFSQRAKLAKTREQLERTVRRAELLASFSAVGKWELPKRA